MTRPASHRRSSPDIRHASRYLSLTVATAAAIASLAACGSSASSPRTVAAPAASSKTTSVAVTAAASAGGTPAGAAPATCAARNLDISNSSFRIGAGGYSAGILTLVNKGPRTCIMDGFPGVELTSAHGKAITNAARGCTYLQCLTAPTRVTLAPGDTAHAEYVWQDSPPEPRQQTCPQSGIALVTPPNAYDHQAVPLHIRPCGIPPVFGVGTVQAGPAPAS